MQFWVQLGCEEHHGNDIVVFELAELEGDLREHVQVDGVSVGHVAELDHPAARVDDRSDSGVGRGNRRSGQSMSSRVGLSTG